MNKEKILKADSQFENYNFGEGVTIVDSEGWNNDGSNDYIRVAYAEIEENEDTTKISFHVEFDLTGNVVDSYAYVCESGVEIGSSKME